MQIACLVYDGFTATDVIGPFDVLSRIPDSETVFVATEVGLQRNDNGVLGVQADRTLDEVPSPDVIVVPGGMEGTRRAARDERVLEWLRTAHGSTRFTTSVCTGSLILGAAGLLRDLDATTHWAAANELEHTGARYVAERWVALRSQRLITAAGVSAGIDMAIMLVAELVGEDIARAIQLGLEYDPQPPYDAGNPDKAGPEAIATLQRIGF